MNLQVGKHEEAPEGTPAAAESANGGLSWAAALWLRGTADDIIPALPLRNIPYIPESRVIKVLQDLYHPPYQTLNPKPFDLKSSQITTQNHLD